MSASVSVVNRQCVVRVVNNATGTSAAVSVSRVVQVTVKSVGIRGPMGGGELDPDFVIDGGNF